MGYVISTCMLKARRSRNRILARDIVLVMPDEESQDPVGLRAALLRKAGALVLESDE